MCEHVVTRQIKQASQVGDFIYVYLLRDKPDICLFNYDVVDDVLFRILCRDENYQSMLNVCDCAEM